MCFSAQADLTAQLKQLLVQPEYPVAEITCDRGGTTYLTTAQMNQTLSALAMPPTAESH